MVISTYLKESSIYILNRIGNSNTYYGKVCWIFIFFTCITGMISQIYQFLVIYYDYPVVINMQKKYHRPYFPAVTVCNVNTVLKEYEPCVNYNLDYNECFYGNQGLKPSTTSVNKSIKFPICEYDHRNFSTVSNIANKWLYSYRSLHYKSRVMYGHTPENFITFCSHGEKPCPTNFFRLWPSILYGNCYVLNTDYYNIEAEKSNTESGLVLELNLEVDKYVKHTETVGVRLQIHDPKIEHDIDRKGIFLKPGYETNIAIQKSIMHRLPPPFKDRCTHYKLGFTELLCKSQCIQNLTLSLCSCVTDITRYNLDMPQCNMIDPVIRCCIAMSEKKAAEICSCPLACKEEIFDIRVSSALWPSPLYYESIKSKHNKSSNRFNLSYEDFRKTNLCVRIYYDTFYYTEYKQTPLYQRFDIFSRIGGHMGLWLGLSVAVITENLINIFGILRKTKIKLRLKSKTVVQQK